MKKKVFLLLCTSMMLLGSCTNQPNEESWEGCGDHCEDLTSISSDFTVDDNTTYESHSWDDKIVSMLKYTVGDVASTIPSYTTTDYAVSIGSQTSDDGSLTIKFTDVKCYPVAESADMDYAQKLKIYGFTDVSSSSYAYSKASATDDLIVQYEVVKGKQFTYLSILCYRVTYRQAEWPSELAESICSYDLPQFKAEAYDGYFDSYNWNGVIDCFSVDDDADTQYSNQLKAKGWTVQETTAYTYSLLSPDGWVTVNLFMTYGSYEENVLMIKFTNAWPYLDLMALLGEDLPKHTNNNLSFEYKYISTDESGNVLTLYYDYADQNDYVTYCSLLEAKGYALDTAYETNKGFDNESSSKIHFSYYIKGDNVVHVLYSETYNTIAIPVYSLKEETK